MIINKIYSDFARLSVRLPADIRAKETLCGVAVLLVGMRSYRLLGGFFCELP
jgi:hypothetical protein